MAHGDKMETDMEKQVYKWSTAWNPCHDMHVFSPRTMGFWLKEPGGFWSDETR